MPRRIPNQNCPPPLPPPSQCSRPSNASAGFLSWNRSPSPADWLAALPLEPVSTQPPAANTMQAHWLGHACIMLRIAGATILTDPVFEPRCSPVSFAGPKRVVPAPCTVASLPPIDVVCISHNHYDHLSASTVEQLLQRFGCRLQWVVPLGLAPWLKSCGVQANVVELDLWGFTSPAQHPHLRVTCVPAQHWSNRTNFDRNKSLWCGWAVHDASSLACSPDAHSPAPPPALPPPPLPCFYFTGDTGWSPLLFAEIAATLDSVTLAALPIGAYEPRWFMAPQHTDPGQAVAIHCALRCRQSFGVHWGTWPLTDEPMDEPVTLLSQKAAEAGLPPTAFVALRHGASGAIAVCRVGNSARALHAAAAEQLTRCRSHGAVRV